MLNNEDKEIKKIEKIIVLKGIVDLLKNKDKYNKGILCSWWGGYRVCCKMCKFNKCCISMFERLNWFK